MKSPFPGMDPYLESYWSNVHVLMMGAIAGALNQTLPSGLAARPEEEVRVETLAGDRVRSYRPDVAVLTRHPRRPAGEESIAVAEPLQIPYRHAPVKLRNVTIVDTRNKNRVVTVIEVLSPWNKRAGNLNEQYVRKLHDYEACSTNWVEIDLLRSSRRRLPVTRQDLPAGTRADYLVITFRADDEKVGVYPILLPDRLPKVAIPLRGLDEVGVLDLQTVIDRVYADGAFEAIDYSIPPVPPLKGENAKWVTKILKGHKSKRA